MKDKTIYGPVRNGLGWYDLPSGVRKWRVVYTQGGKVKGKGGFTTKSAASHWQAHNTTAIDTNTYVDPKRQRSLFGPYALAWFEIKKPDIRPNTIKWYDSLLRNHVLPAFADLRFADIDRQEIKGWLAELKRDSGLAPATVAKAYRLLRQILAEAVEDGYLPHNPANIKGAGVEPKMDETRYEDATPETVRRLADHMRDEVTWVINPRTGRKTRRHRRHAKYRALVKVAGLEGPRWGEAIALQRKHYDRLHGKLRIRQQIQDQQVVPYTKTDAGRRTIRLTSEGQEDLNYHLDHFVTDPSPNAFLFLARPRSGRTAFLRAGNFRRSVWLPAIRVVLGAELAEDEAIVDLLRFHDLRHAAGTLGANAGLSVKDNQYRLGHATESAALRYQHSTDESRRLAAARIDAYLATTTPAATGTDDNVRHLPQR